MVTKSDPRGSRTFKLFAALAFCFSSAAWATDYYVVPGGAGTKDGTSWANALGDVQAAIDACAASGSGTVKIAAGTYKPASQPNLVPSGVPAPSPAPPAIFNHFSLRNNVKVWGGYKQSPETRDPQLYPTILSGDLGGNDKDSDGDGLMDANLVDNCRVFYHPPWASLDSTAQLDGVTISGGCGRDNSYYSGGGSLNGGGTFEASGVSPTISNCVFRDNTSGGSGGAFYKEGACSNSAPILDRCTFVANKASGGGAVAFSAASSSSVVNCTFVANSATMVGGAVFTSGGSISFANCTFVNNRAPETGGGVFSTAPVTNCIFWGNASNSPANLQLTANSVTYSIVQGGFTGAGNLNKDPLLLPLKNYGGSTPTMALRGDSPAIDSGQPATTTDQRGYGRKANRDIGAFEYQPGPKFYIKPGGTGNGTSWANASGNLASAISAAPGNSAYQTEIWVAEGTYTGTFALRSYISVFGGFSGVETKLGERDIAAHPTILSADLNGDDADTDGDGIPDAGTSENVDEVCSSHAVLPSAMLDGFILSGARTAAIRNYTGPPYSLNSPTIANCTFRYNAGASVQNDSYSAPAILNCTFHHNSTTSPVMTNAVITSPSVVNCTFNNSSTKDSMPIVLNQTQSSSPKFFNCTFAVGAYQTAISNASSTSPVLRNCIIWGNSNTPAIQGGTPIVSRCVIQGGFSGGKKVSTLDPLLMPLRNYGGPTPTMPVFALSSAIGLEFEPGPGGADAPYADQRGFTRDAKTDIGACEWQQNYAVIQTKDGTDRYAIGTRAILSVVSESYDLTAMSGLTWQWYGASEGTPIGGTPIDGATQSSYGTPPLTADASYFVSVWGNSAPSIPAGITLKAYSPNVIHVSTTGNDANDGSSWALAKRNLQSAMDASKSGDHIWVASGTYTNSGPTPISLRSGVSVYGGFSGVETRLDQRKGTATVLSADYAGNDADLNGVPDPATTQDNGQVIFANDKIGSSSVLDGFVLSGATSAAVGNANGSSPTISNCTFRSNSGASVQNDSSSSPSIVNCTFSGNSTAVPNVLNRTQSSPKIINCTFAVGATQAAISSDPDCTPAITNSIIAGNLASSAIQGGSPSVSSCFIQVSLSSDPKLMPLGNYGGPTPTRPVMAGSPAINQGLAGADIPYADQRGLVRDATPDIGACEWQQNFAVIQSGSEANRYAVGSTASLSVVSESALQGTIWQWYRGAVGDMTSPIAGATLARYVTPPLTADTSYWVRGLTQNGPIDVGITLSVYVPHVIYVSKTGVGDGSSWQSPMTSLQSALAAAQSGDQIWVASGTYREVISLRNGVSIYGGFSGTETRLDHRDIAAHPTVLSADTFGNDADSDGDGVPDSGTSENAPSVCSNSGVDSSAVLDGFILSGARDAAIVNTGASPTSGSSPTISNCTFRYNSGTCMQNQYASAPGIMNCTFHHNAASKVVIQNYGTGSSSVANSTFVPAPAPGKTPVPIIENQSGAPKILDCTFAAIANQAAIYNAAASSPTIVNCIIWGNANKSGIMNNSSSASVWNCVIQGGFAAGTNIITQDPKLLPLGDYGGATPTMPVGVGSPAINAGMAGTDVPYADQRGFVRDAQPDIGACERQQQGDAASSPENGGFETGDFTGWATTTTDASKGNWRVYSGTTTPGGMPVYTPPEGSSGAVAEQPSGLGTQILYQDIKVPAAPAQTLSLRVHYKNYAGTTFNTPSSLDYLSGSNQQYRIDLISRRAAVDSMAPADVLANVFVTSPGSPQDLSPTVVTFNLAPYAGTTVRLRIAVAAGLAPLTAGVDDVRLVSSAVGPRTLVNNGSFENGLADWIVSDLSSPFQALQVRPNGYSPGAGLFSCVATDGAYSATHGFDGSGPGVISIAKDVLVPASAPYLVFDYRIAWDMLTSNATLPRIFRVVIRPGGGEGMPLLSSTILTAQPGTQNLDSGPLTGVVDLTSFAGSTVRICFESEIPEAFKGPGFFELDNVGFAAGSMVNGGFESGDFTGWATTTTNATYGNWRVYSGTATPGGKAIDAPPEGSFGAAAEQTVGPGTQILYRDIAVPATSLQTLSMRVYYKNQGPTFLTPNTLNYASGANQQYRIDLISPSAAVDSLAPADVLANVFITSPGSPQTLSPTVVTFNLAPYAGTTVRLRLAAVSALAPLTAGVDDVLLVDAATTPLVVTGATNAVTSTSATLNGTVNPNGLATTAKFEYGLTTSYGGAASVTLSPTDGAAAQDVSRIISGLQSGKTYHYRLTATNSQGVGVGNDATFTTPDTTPPVFSNIPAGGAVRVGSAVPNLVALATATDNSAGPITITQSPVAGSIFTPVGPFTVTLTATDPSGNPANATVNFTVREATSAEYFGDWAGNAALSGSNAAAMAAPFNDGVPNLLKYAFNMNGSGPDARVLVSGTGTAGLPNVTVEIDATTGNLRAEFVRRIGAGLTYTPEKCSALSADSWTPFTATPTVVPIDAAWERAIYNEPFDPKTTPRIFGRVKVVLP